MHRQRCTPRPDWPQKVERLGFTFHSHETGPYWDESACYTLTANEVDALEKSATDMHRLCIEAAEAVILHGWWHRLGIPDWAIPTILDSWERDDFSLYGRFDLAYDGRTPPKLLEYNADTPTALIEASVVQWFWLQELHPHDDQFNSLHERLIAAWRRWAGCTIHFSCVKDSDEDEQTVLYLRDTCEQAGVKTQPVYVEDIGWDDRREQFVDLELAPITHCFKLYPWEWMWTEEFAIHLIKQKVHFIEPAWKMLISNKGLLPILWELFPGHPNLLPAFDKAGPLHGSFVRKPILSREGQNIAWVDRGVVVEENCGGYGEEGYIYQAPASMLEFEGNRPVFGVWIIDHEPAGLGIREDTRRITGNLSRFIPHYFH